MTKTVLIYWTSLFLYYVDQENHKNNKVYKTDKNESKPSSYWLKVAGASVCFLFPFIGYA